MVSKYPFRSTSVHGCPSFFHRIQRILCRTPGAKSIRDGQKVRLEDRLQDQLGGCPDHPVSYRGYIPNGRWPSFALGILFRRTAEEHRKARERKRRAECDAPREGGRVVRFRRSAARERRWRRKAGPCDTASSHCGSPGAVRSVPGMDAGRTQAAEGHGCRLILCTQNRTDPISGFANNSDAPGGLPPPEVCPRPAGVVGRKGRKLDRPSFRRGSVLLR